MRFILINFLFSSKQLNWGQLVKSPKLKQATQLMKVHNYVSGAPADVDGAAEVMKAVVMSPLFTRYRHKQVGMIGELYPSTVLVPP